MKILDPRDYLPDARVSQYRRGEHIYGPGNKQLFLIADGRVEVATSSRNGIVIDYYRQDHFFGASCLSYSKPQEYATAMQDGAKVMSWSVSQITQKPEPGWAISQILATRAAEAADRIESMAKDSLERRLAKALLRWTERDGITLAPLSHEFLSRYVGTTRPVITRHMGGLRRKKLLEFSRLTGIHVRPVAMAEWLERAS